jgi:hypothetical protein
MKADRGAIALWPMTAITPQSCCFTFGDGAASLSTVPHWPAGR